MFSQTYDTDKKIRDLADRLYIVKKCLRLWTTCTPYVKTPVILPAGETRDTAKMADDFVRIPKFFFAGVVTFIPRWVNEFDSFIDDQSDYRLQLSPAEADPPAGGDVTGNARPVPDPSESARMDQVARFPARAINKKPPQGGFFPFLRKSSGETADADLYHRVGMQEGLTGKFGRSKFFSFFST